MAILLPPGVTKKSIDTLISRRVSPFAVSATVEVACLHGRGKRTLTELAVSPSDRSRVHICPCCENLTVRATDEPGRCDTCSPKETT